MPDVDTLKRWLKRELTPDRSREVSRWVVRSTDPSVGVALRALSREIEEEERNLRQLRVRPETAPAISLWERLLGLGTALWEAPSRQPSLAPALSAGRRLKTPVLMLVGDTAAQGGTVELTVQVPRATSATVLASTESGEVHVLVEPRPMGAGTHQGVAAWTHEEGEGEVTFWLASSASPASLQWAAPGLSWAAFELAANDATLSWSAVRAERD